MTTFEHLTQALVAFGLALMGSYLLTPVVEQVARQAGAVRAPRVRDVHTREMPLWGGIAIVIGVCLAVVFTVPLRGAHTTSLTGIFLGALVVAVFGIIDDRFDLSALIQMVVLLGAGYLVTLFGVKISFLTNPFGGMIDLDDRGLSVPLTMLWIFFTTKATDIIDGVDGLAAGVSAISSATLGLMALQTGNIVSAVLAAALCGGAIGFLRHNFNPARIFMGTVGAQFLGFMLACLSIISLTKVATAVTLAVAVLVLGVPLLDAVFVTLRRLVTMQPLHVADKGHVHHRLLKKGLSQRETVLLLYVVSLCFCILALGVYTLGK